jgi:hypothetical protein
VQGTESPGQESLHSDYADGHDEKEDQRVIEILNFNSH